jgi:hypothetical protein
LLKALSAADPAGLLSDARDPDLAQEAAAWQATVESALALRLGTGQKARETAALLFRGLARSASVVQGGQSGFKLKDAVKRLT